MNHELERRHKHQYRDVQSAFIPSVPLRAHGTSSGASPGATATATTSRSSRSRSSRLTAGPAPAFPSSRSAGGCTGTGAKAAAARSTCSSSRLDGVQTDRYGVRQPCCRFSAAEPCSASKGARASCPQPFSGQTRAGRPRSCGVRRMTMYTPPEARLPGKKRQHGCRTPQPRTICRVRVAVDISRP